MAAVVFLFTACENQTSSSLKPQNAEISSLASESFSDLPTMVMNGNLLYLDTGRESSVTGRCGVMDGEILSSVDAGKIPSENGQSNFGTGFGYQYGPEEGTIELLIDGKWFVFKAE